jgi:hypothetical protein
MPEEVVFVRGEDQLRVVVEEATQQVVAGARQGAG